MKSYTEMILEDHDFFEDHYRSAREFHLSSKGKTEASV